MTYYGSAEYLADVAQEALEQEAAALAARAEALAQYQREAAAHRKAEYEDGLCHVRAPYTGAIVRTYRVAAPARAPEAGQMERYLSNGGL